MLTRPPTKHLLRDSYTPTVPTALLFDPTTVVELLVPVLLIAIGLTLIVVEVYLIPGFNVVGVLGVVLIAFGVGYVYMDSGVLGGTVALVASLAAGGGVFWWLWTSGAWDRFILATSLKVDEAQVARENDYRARYLGKEGVAVTPLRPTGIVEIDGERIEVVTEGSFIAAGSQVRVVAMDRRRYFVRLTDSVTPANAG